MTTDVTHRTDGSLVTRPARYGYERYGEYESLGLQPASALAVTHRQDGQTSVEHR